MSLTLYRIPDNFVFFFSTDCQNNPLEKATTEARWNTNPLLDSQDVAVGNVL